MGVRKDLEPSTEQREETILRGLEEVQRIFDNRRSMARKT